MNHTINLNLDDDDLARLDSWRQEVEPIVDRATAAQQLIGIALDDVEGLNSKVGVEIIDTIALGISTMMQLETDANKEGLVEISKAAHRTQEVFQGLAVFLGIESSTITRSVFERLDAVNDAPDEKH